MAGGGRRGGGLAGRLGAPILFPALLALAAAVLAWWQWDRLAALRPAALAQAPETQVREALRHQRRAHLDDVYGWKAGGTAELVNLAFHEVAVQVEGGKAQVVALVDGDGKVTWREEQATLSWVGRETFTMSPCSIALWCGDGRQFESLRGVLTALFRRHDAFQARDPARYARLVSEGYRGAGGRAALLARLSKDLAGPPARLSPRAWQVRVDRDKAEVGEDYELTVGGAPPARLRARFELRREGERWLFVDGL